MFCFSIANFISIVWCEKKEKFFYYCSFFPSIKFIIQTLSNLIGCLGIWEREREKININQNRDLYFKIASKKGKKNCEKFIELNCIYDEAKLFKAHLALYWFSSSFRPNRVSLIFSSSRLKLAFKIYKSPYNVSNFRSYLLWKRFCPFTVF